MATPTDLIGLGLPVFVANLVTTHLSSVTAQGAAAGSATQIPGPSRIAYALTTNSGNGFLLPAVNGDINGANRTDRVVVANLLGAAVIVYAANNAQGSVVTFYMDGASTAGTTGVSVAAGKSMEFMPISVSTWIGIRSA